MTRLYALCTYTAKLERFMDHRLDGGLVKLKPSGVHVAIWYLPGPETSPCVLTFGPMYVLYKYLDPLGHYRGSLGGRGGCLMA